MSIKIVEEFGTFQFDINFDGQKVCTDDIDITVHTLPDMMFGRIKELSRVKNDKLFLVTFH